MAVRAHTLKSYRYFRKRVCVLARAMSYVRAYDTWRTRAFIRVKMRIRHSRTLNVLDSRTNETTHPKPNLALSKRRCLPQEDCLLPLCNQTAHESNDLLSISVLIQSSFGLIQSDVARPTAQPAHKPLLMHILYIYLHVPNDGLTELRALDLGGALHLQRKRG